MDPPLIIARALHFGAELSLLGFLVFPLLVATPVHARWCEALPLALRRRYSAGAWASFAVAALTLVPWLLLVAHNISGAPWRDLITAGILPTVLSSTQFGEVWLLRVLFLAALVPCLVMIGRRRAVDFLGVALAAVFVAATAWQGHAGAGTGFAGAVHLGADAAHLIAAGGWLGSLVPLAVLLERSQHAEERGHGIAAAGAQAFSNLGVACVAILLVSGLVNSWFLVGSFVALFGTIYGRLLVVKLTLVAAMLVIAIVNRFALMRRLRLASSRGRMAAATLARNALIEAAIGLGVITIAATLGTLAPPAHEPASIHDAALILQPGAPSHPH